MNWRKIFPCICVLMIFSYGLIYSQEKKESEQKSSEKFKKWLEEEVVYIISQAEKSAFLGLKSNKDKEDFIELFWRRRDPTPQTPLNEFREEHYRRIAYATKNYFEGKAGWRTDRGRIYIMYGPPDFFETNPGGSSGFIFGPSAPTKEFPSEIWTYRYIPGLKTRTSRVDFTFINYYNAGSYQLTLDPAVANALRNVSVPERYVGYGDIPENAEGLTALEIMERHRNFSNLSSMEQLTQLAQYNQSRGEMFEELERSARIRKVKGIVEARASLSELGFSYDLNFFRRETDATYIPICVDVPAQSIEFKKKADRYHGQINYYIEIKDNSETVYQSNDRLEMNLKEKTYQRRFEDNYQYLHGLTLKPGNYTVHLVVWDEFSGKVGYVDEYITVPQFFKEELCLSDIILAKEVKMAQRETKEIEIKSKDIPALKNLESAGIKIPEKTTIKEKQMGPFTFGNLEVIPSTRRKYHIDDELVFFYQIYNPTFDQTQKSAHVIIEHHIEKDGRKLAQIGQRQSVQIPMEHKGQGLNSGSRFQLKKAIAEAGNYTLIIRVEDTYSKRIIEKRSNFKVELREK